MGLRSTDYDCQVAAQKEKKNLPCNQHERVFMFFDQIKRARLNWYPTIDERVIENCAGENPLRSIRNEIEKF